MSEFKVPLRRRQYANPAIVTAVVQIVLDWDVPRMQAFCQAIDEEARQTFSGVLKQNLKQFDFEVIDGGAQAPKVQEGPGGVVIQVDGSGSQITIEPSGYRVLLQGPYPGRERLFGLSEWVACRLSQFFGDLTVKRASILYESHILPQADIFQIEDYIVPRFELDDEALSFFQEFRHVIALDLSRLVEGPIRAILRVGSDLQRGGFSVIVDVLDESTSNLNDIQKRIQKVKDIETHIFECTIKDKTRQLYGEQ